MIMTKQSKELYTMKLFMDKNMPKIDGWCLYNTVTGKRASGFIWRDEYMAKGEIGPGDTLEARPIRIIPASEPIVIEIIEELLEWSYQRWKEVLEGEDVIVGTAEQIVLLDLRNKLSTIVKAYGANK